MSLIWILSGALLALAGFALRDQSGEWGPHAVPPLVAGAFALLAGTSRRSKSLRRVCAGVVWGTVLPWVEFCIFAVFNPLAAGRVPRWVHLIAALAPPAGAIAIAIWRRPALPTVAAGAAAVAFWGALAINAPLWVALPAAGLAAAIVPLVVLLAGLMRDSARLFKAWP